MARRDAAMTFAGLITLQVAEPFFPICLKYVPNESKIIEPLAILGRKGVYSHPLNTHPLTKSITLFLMLLRDATMPLSVLINFLNIRNLPANLLQADSKQIQGYRVVADVLLNHLLSVEL